MDPNNYVIAAILNGLQHKQNGTLPVEAEFTPFNLAHLRNAPEREPQREVTVKGQVVPPKYAQTTA